MKAKRKVIFECKTGSHMYGTNLPTSDDDFKGVFLPGFDDLFNLKGRCPDEWDQSIVAKGEDGKNTSDAVDRTFYSIQKFLSNAIAGQPWALEMLFCPPEMVVSSSIEWDYIISHIDKFLSKNMGGFYGFAKSQADRAVIKGERLNTLQATIKLLKKLSESYSLSNYKIKDQVLGVESCGNVAWFGTDADLTVKINHVKSGDGTPSLEIAGREFNYGLTLRKLLGSLTKMELNYGERVRTAAADGYDWKSLYHAYRLISEAEEFLATGKIPLPRPDADFLLQVRKGEYDADHREELMKGCARIEVAKELSTLPKDADKAEIELICSALLLKSIAEGLK